MPQSRERRLKFANGLIGVGALLVISFFGMAFGAPLITWGIDLRRQLREEMEESQQASTDAQPAEGA